MTRAAAIAFYAMLATVPFLALILTLAVQQLPDLTSSGRPTAALGDMTVEQLDVTMNELLPQDAYVVVRNQIKRIQDEPPVGLLSLGLAIALWTASSLFLTIMDSLNRIAGVAENRSLVNLRLTAMAMTLLQAAVLLGSLVSIVAWPQILRRLGLDPDGAAAWLATMARWAAVVVLLLMSFALTSRIGPATRGRWRCATPGGVAGTAAILGFSSLFRPYVQYISSYNATYGSLSGVVLLLFWYWAASLVLLVAAEIDQAIESASPEG
jgi:membrane protein